MFSEKSPDSTKRKKRIVGIVAITLLVLFTILAIIQALTVFWWIIADLIVAAAANLILKAIGRNQK
jgi:hypothetical protein